MIVTSLPLEARAEWQELLSSALNGSRKVDDAAVLRAEVALAGFEWSRIITRSYVLAGLRNSLKDISKSESVALVAHNGTHVTKTTRVGARRRRVDGSPEAQQVLIHEMTWDELSTWLQMIAGQIASLLVNKAMAEKLLALRSRFPESKGPGDACRLLGMTVEQYLAV